MATVAEVAARVSQVRTAYEQAMSAATSTGIWQTDEEKKSLQALTSMRSSIEAWSSRGSVAAASGSEPVGGWSSWIRGGNGLLDGMRAASDIADFGTLDALKTTIALAPSHAAGDLKAGAAIAGDVVSGAAAGFLGKAWWVIALIAAAAVGVVLLKREALR